MVDQNVLFSRVSLNRFSVWWTCTCKFTLSVSRYHEMWKSVKKWELEICCDYQTYYTLLVTKIRGFEQVVIGSFIMTMPIHLICRFYDKTWHYPGASTSTAKFFLPEAYGFFKRIAHLWTGRDFRPKTQSSRTQQSSWQD